MERVRLLWLARRAASLAWCGALAFSACGEASEPPPSSRPEPAMSAPARPASEQTAELAVAVPRPAPSDVEARGAPGAVAADEVLVTSSDTHARAGHLAHDFEVESDCPLARVELDLEVESMPDGQVVLTAPSGASQRLALHVLTTTHFVRTWDWQLLPALHALRGTPAQGTWTLSVQARGAEYQGGAQPSSAPMPTPTFPRAELRVFCEPPRAPATDSFDVRVPVAPSAARAGANVRALVPVGGDCTIATLTFSTRERWTHEIGSPLVLVTPGGAALRVDEAAPMRVGPRETFSRDVSAAHGLASAGLWEIVRPRASGNVTFEEASIEIDCAP